MHPVQAVFRKELIDGFRDRRALLTAFLFPALAPILIYGLIYAIIDMSSDAENLEVAVINAESAPALIQYMQEKGVEITTFTGNAEQAVKDKKQEFILEIPGDYQQRLRDFKTTIVPIIHDSSRSDTRVSLRRLRDLVREYNGQLSALRLIARGVSPSVIRGVVSGNQDIASEEQRLISLFSMVPLYIMLAAFIAGMGLAVDSTAGERERKSLEPLLVNPVQRLHLIQGKWLAASFYAAIGMLSTLVLSLIVMLNAPLEDIGFIFSISIQQVIMLILATLPLPFLATSLEMLLGIFAKSFKDAQSYIGLVTLLPTLPFLIDTFNPVTTQDWMYATPIFGQYLLMNEVLGAVELSWLAYASSGVSCLLLSVLLCFLTSRLLSREAVITG